MRTLLRSKQSVLQVARSWVTQPQGLLCLVLFRESISVTCSQTSGRLPDSPHTDFETVTGVVGLCADLTQLD